MIIKNILTAILFLPSVVLFPILLGAMTKGKVLVIRYRATEFPMATIILTIIAIPFVLSLHFYGHPLLSSLLTLSLFFNAVFVSLKHFNPNDKERGLPTLLFFLDLGLFISWAYFIYQVLSLIGL